jgi:hypothetical protein
MTLAVYRVDQYYVFISSSSFLSPTLNSKYLSQTTYLLLFTIVDVFEDVKWDHASRLFASGASRYLQRKGIKDSITASPTSQRRTLPTHQSHRPHLIPIRIFNQLKSHRLDLECQTISRTNLLSPQLNSVVPFQRRARIGSCLLSLPLETSGLNVDSLPPGFGRFVSINATLGFPLPPRNLTSDGLQQPNRTASFVPICISAKARRILRFPLLRAFTWMQCSTSCM